MGLVRVDNWLACPVLRGTEQATGDSYRGKGRRRVPCLCAHPVPLAKLKRIDLSSNCISSIDADALSLLPELQELILPENQLAALPKLPPGIEVLDARLNRLQSSGIQPEVLRVSQGPRSTIRHPPLMPTTCIPTLPSWDVLVPPPVLGNEQQTPWFSPALICFTKGSL